MVNTRKPKKVRKIFIVKCLFFTKNNPNKIIHFSHLTSAAIKDRVCIPCEYPTSTQTTARLQQDNNMETSNANTLTWLLIGVVGEKDN